MMTTIISCITSLYRCQEYLENYLAHVTRIDNLSEVEFILVHNDPLDIEVDIISTFIDSNQGIEIIYKQVPLEGLYTSWNRAIRISRGEYIAIWNVDDIRYPDSLSVQANTLVANPDVALVYGNHYISREYGSEQVSSLIAENLDHLSWYKRFQGGCFYMWRRQIHDQIGFFDEQLMSAADQDFWYRVAEEYRIVLVNNFLGVYLEDSDKGLSKRHQDADVEKIVIGARYGYFSYINNWNWWRAASQYQWRKIYFFDQFLPRSIFRYHSVMVYLHSVYILGKSLLKFVKNKLFEPKLD